MLEATTKSIWSSKLYFLSEKSQGILLVMSVATLLDLSLKCWDLWPFTLASFASFPSLPGEVAMVFSSIQLASDHVSLFSRLLLYSKANGLHKWIERTRSYYYYIWHLLFTLSGKLLVCFFLSEKRKGKKYRKFFLKKKMSVPNHADYLSLF